MNSAIIMGLAKRNFGSLGTSEWAVNSTFAIFATHWTLLCRNELRSRSRESLVLQCPRGGRGPLKKYARRRVRHLGTCELIGHCTWGTDSL